MRKMRSRKRPARPRRSQPPAAQELVRELRIPADPRHPLNLSRRIPGEPASPEQRQQQSPPPQPRQAERERSAVQSTSPAEVPAGTTERSKSRVRALSARSERNRG